MTRTYKIRDDCVFLATRRAVPDLTFDEPHYDAQRLTT
jgi:hypothetical protein